MPTCAKPSLTATTLALPARSRSACRYRNAAVLCRVASSRVSVSKSTASGAYEIKPDSGKNGSPRVLFHGVHHVALICANLERSLDFYCGLLSLEVNPDRPHSKLPYRGAWLWIGPEMIHLMELPNPDPLTGRPEHGGRDRHFCVGIESIEPLEERLKAAGVEYTRSMSGRPAIFFRDPDANCLECVQLEEPWR